MYTPNNLHIITLYKLSCKSRSSCRAVLFDKFDIAKMHGLDTSNVSCRDVTSLVEFGLQPAILSWWNSVQC